MKLTVYEVLSLRRIRGWERERHPGLQRRLLDLASRPIEAAMAHFGAETLRAAEEAVEATIGKLLHASSYAVDPQRLIRRARAHGVIIAELSQLRRCDLRLLDRCNRKHIKFHRRVVTLQGALLGLGGGLSAVADATAFLMVAFKLIQEVAYCHGFDPNDPLEKQIILRVILAALGSSEIKSGCLEEIDELAAAQRPDRRGAPQLSTIGARALDRYVGSLTVCLLIREVPHLLPIISVIAAAQSNREMMAATGRTAFMVYRKRFIERKRALDDAPC